MKTVETNKVLPRNLTKNGLTTCQTRVGKLTADVSAFTFDGKSPKNSNDLATTNYIFKTMDNDNFGTKCRKTLNLLDKA